ncbi:MAG TPA: BON domain-containing protein [Chitinophagaceae bacterium]
MSTNNSYGRGPLHSRSWDEREEQRHQQDYRTGWSGSGSARGFDKDPYRGYYGSGPTGGDFAASYSHSYGRDDYRSEEQRRRERSGSPGGEGDRRRWESYDWEDRVTNRPQSENRRSDGPHRGKGPKDYKRSDERIREDVSDRLADDPYVDASDIVIKVEDGNVILSGRVDHRDARRRAVELAEGVRGVSNVESHLRTGQGTMENLSHAVTAAIGDVTLGPEVSTVDTPKKGRKRKGLL